MRDQFTHSEADARSFENAHTEPEDADDRPSLAELDRDEWEMRQIADERESHTATPGEAHAEWHRNAGVPMGQPGCPQDACHLPDDFEPAPGPGEGIRCAHCKGRHWDVATVRECAGQEDAARWTVTVPDPWGVPGLPGEPPF